MIQQLARVTVLTAVSVIFCALTAVLGAAPLFVLRNTEGRIPFFAGAISAICILLSFKAYALAVPFVGMVLLVLAFSEGIELGGGLLKSSAIALTLCSGVGLVALGAWSRSQGIEVVSWIREQLSTLISQVPQLQNTVMPEIDSVIAQTPSVALMIMSISLWAGILFGRRFSSEKTSREFLAIRLKDFTIPDEMVWLFIASLPGTFMPQDVNLWHVISINVFNFMIFLYFLKGIAIVATYFAVYRVGLLWQGLMYLIFISQLFLLVSLIGLADIWMNLKIKLLKKSAEPVER